MSKLTELSEAYTDILYENLRKKFDWVRVRENLDAKIRQALYLHSDRDELRWYYQSIETLLEAAPWYLDIESPSTLATGAPLTCFLSPDIRKRNRMGCQDMAEYSDGYEFPLMLLDEKLTATQVSELNTATHIVTDTIGCGFLRGSWKTSMAIGFLMGMLLKRRCVSDLIFELPLLLQYNKLYVTGKPRLDQARLELLNLDSNEQLLIERWRASASFRIDDLIEVFKSNLSEIVAIDLSDTSDLPGFLWTLSLPFGWVTYDQWQRVASARLKVGIDFEVPTLPVDFRDALFITGFNQPFKEFRSRMLQGAGEITEETIENARLTIEMSKSNRIVKMGDYWVFSYAEKTIHLKNTKGAQYIDFLIRHMGKSISAGALFEQFTDVPTVNSDEVDDQIQWEHGMRSSDGHAEKLDKESYKQLKLELQGLRKRHRRAVEKDNHVQAEKLSSEILKMEHYLNSTFDKLGRERISPNPVDKPRSAMQQSVNRVYKRLKLDHPDLERHLRASLRIGRNCCYQPSQPIDWKFS